MSGCERVLRSRVGRMDTLLEENEDGSNEHDVQPQDQEVSQDPPVTVESTTQGTKRKNTSNVWEHFDVIENSNPRRASCKYCNQSYACESGKNGTSTMKKHISNRCKKAPNRISDESQMSLSFKKTKEGNDLVAVSYNYDVCRRALTEMIILDELPFRFVEGAGFKRYSKALQPKFNPPGRNTVARDCIKLYLDEKKKLMTHLKGKRVCMTTDTWTSIQNLTYMCLTAHYVDSEWKLQKRILNFSEVPNHKGETIGRIVETCMLEWGIGSIFTMTLDNASANNVAIDWIKRKTNHLSGTILDHSYLHMRCAAHILNLVVSDGLSEVDDAIVKIRNAVRYVRSSSPRMAKFKKCVATMKVDSSKTACLDVATRWNSTYLMLEVAVKYKTAFLRLEDDDSDFLSYFGDVHSTSSGKVLLGPPSLSDWKAAEVYLKFLRLFYDSTLKVSGFKHVTSNVFFKELFKIEKTLNQLVENNDTILGLNAKKMKEKFDKYWSWNNINILLYVALVLDPRYKLEYLSFCFEELYGLEKAKIMEGKVKNVFTSLYDFYRSMDGQDSFSSSTSQTGFGSSGTNVVDNVDDVIVDVDSRFYQRLMQKDNLTSSSEVDRYLQERCESQSFGFDILCWWKVNSGKYRVLSLVAKDVLAIPVSSVASESAFSTGGRILDPYRSSLAPSTVEALICSQDWLKASIASTPDIEDEFEQLAIIDKEMLGSSKSTITTEID